MATGADADAIGMSAVVVSTGLGTAVGMGVSAVASVDHATTVTAARRRRTRRLSWPRSGGRRGRGRVLQSSNIGWILVMCVIW